jgi:hypothetical protein
LSSQLQGILGPPVSNIGVLIPLASVAEVEPIVAALRKTGLRLHVRLEPLEVSFDEMERARGALRAAGLRVLPASSVLEVQLVNFPNGVQALIAEPGHSPAPAWIGESNEVVQLLAQLRRWAPKAAVRLVADADVPAKQVQSVRVALEKAGVNVGTSA